ncbi:MAG: tetratricopeptide repeat protein [Acidiferrobacterales bacterium]
MRTFRLKWTALIGVGLVLATALVSCSSRDSEQAAEHLKKGKELLTAGQYEAATKELKKAAELDIDAMEPRLLLGNAYRALKRYDEAFEAYRAAKKVDRYVATPHIESALARVELGQIDVAIEELNHAIELDSDNIAALIHLGRVSRMPRPPPKGDAETELGRFVNPDPQAGYERAELNLSRAVELAPDNIEANYELAKTYEELGKRDEAVTTWQKVRQLVANKPEHASVAAEATEALTRLSP